MPSLHRLRAAEILAREGLMDDLCDHVANGGDGIEFARAVGVSWAALWAWIEEDDARRAAWQSAQSGAMEWTRQSLLRELRAMATSDLRQAFREDGTMRPPAEWPEGLARAISAVESGPLGVGRVKLWDKAASIKLLGSTIRLFLEAREQTPLEDTLEALVLRSMAPPSTLDATPVLALPEATDAKGVTVATETQSQRDEAPPAPTPGFCASPPVIPSQIPVDPTN